MQLQIKREDRYIEGKEVQVADRKGIYCIRQNTIDQTEAPPQPPKQDRQTGKQQFQHHQ